MNQNLRRNRKGFTLIEVLIVVVILGILAATVLPQFTSANSDAKQAALVQNLQTLRSQIQLYKFQHGGKTPALGSTLTLDFKNALLATTDVKGVYDATGKGAYGPYILGGQLPANPYTSGRGVKIVAAPIASFTPDETATDGTDKVGWVYSPSEGLLRGNNQDTASDGTPLFNL